MSYEDSYIRKCRNLIEQKLAWGDSGNWRSQDFDTLSERIFEETNISISSSTLKRIWGKVKYESSPNLATLNALVLFIGYENWRAFTSHGQPEVELSAEPLEEISKKPIKNIHLIFAGIALIVSFLGFWAFKKKSEAVNFHNLVFTSKPVTVGIPNTVIFQYDAAKSNADSVFIQQSWDPKLRVKVDKNLHQFTTTYYHPGYYKAKLFLNDSLAKEHDLFLESDGWLGMIENKNIPIYFTKHEILKSGAIGVTEAEVKAKGADLKNEIPWVSFYNIGKDKVMPGEHFELETEVKNTFSSGNGVCQNTQIIVLFKNGVIEIPLGIKGCIGELNLLIGNKLLQGKTNDLSGFGVDFNEFVKLKCVVKNHEIKILINGKMVYKGDFRQNTGDIVGTLIMFKGAGMIKTCILNK